MFYHQSVYTDQTDEPHEEGYLLFDYFWMTGKSVFATSIGLQSPSQDVYIRRYVTLKGHLTIGYIMDYIHKVLLLGNYLISPIYMYD